MPGSAVTWQGVAAVLAAVLAIVSGVAAWKATTERNAQAQEVKGWLTGGDSWAYFVPWRTPDGNLAFFLRHTGRYPAYDVVLRVGENQGESAPIYLAPALLGGRGFEWITVPDLVFPPRPQPNQSRRIQLQISMRSGTIVIQSIRLWEVSGAWNTDSKNITKNGFAIRPPDDFPEAQNLQR